MKEKKKTDDSTTFSIPFWTEAPLCMAFQHQIPSGKSHREVHQALPCHPSNNSTIKADNFSTLARKNR